MGERGKGEKGKGKKGKDGDEGKNVVYTDS